MKKVFKQIVILLSIILVFLLVSTIYHHVMLNIESDKIIPNGTIVEVGGHKIHIYAEGEKNSKPTLIFMSGSGTVAPVYDFKSLYTEFASNYRIIVIERAGYGYSEICDISRDIKTILSEDRQALSIAGECAPYVLFPHSMSGIEAIYWTQQYPEEIYSIIGLDMSVPEIHDSNDKSNFMIKFQEIAAELGLHRLISGVYPFNKTALTPHEVDQQKYLMYRNSFNLDYALESDSVSYNAKIVAKGGISKIPMLLFISDGKHLSFGERLPENWIPSQKRFAREANSELVYLHCGHYVHHFEYKKIATKVKEFLITLP